MCDKVVNTCPFVFDYVLDRYILKNCVIKLFSKYLLSLNIFMINIRLKMCDKAFDSYLLALKSVPDLFVTSKMIEKL